MFWFKIHFSILHLREDYKELVVPANALLFIFSCSSAYSDTPFKVTHCHSGTWWRSCQLWQSPLINGSFSPLLTICTFSELCHSNMWHVLDFVEFVAGQGQECVIWPLVLPLSVVTIKQSLFCKIMRGILNAKIFNNFHCIWNLWFCATEWRFLFLYLPRMW